MRIQNGWQRIAGVALLFLAGGRGLAQGADLHLVQQFEIRQGTTTLLQEQRELFQQGNAVILRNPTHHFLIRGDLQRAWLLDADRQIVSEVPSSSCAERWREKTSARCRPCTGARRPAPSWGWSRNSTARPQPG